MKTVNIELTIRELTLLLTGVTMLSRECFSECGIDSPEYKEVMAMNNQLVSLLNQVNNE